jgi:hypothetical protein
LLPELSDTQVHPSYAVLCGIISGYAALFVIVLIIIMLKIFSAGKSIWHAVCVDFLCNLSLEIFSFQEEFS